jgi:hypothetical protein
VNDLTLEDLRLRKANCRYWIGCWSEEVLVWSGFTISDYMMHNACVLITSNWKHFLRYIWDNQEFQIGNKALWDYSNREQGTNLRHTTLDSDYTWYVNDWTTLRSH